MFGLLSLVPDCFTKLPHSSMCALFIVVLTLLSLLLSVNIPQI